MEETTDALGLMEGREEEWRQESEEGRSTRQKSDGRKKERGKGGAERAEEKLGTKAPITLAFRTFKITETFLLVIMVNTS